MCMCTRFLSYTWSVKYKNNTCQQRFCPMSKNVRFWCIFGCWIHTCFQNFSITHTFHSRLKGWNLLHQETKVCFYSDAVKNSRISSPRKMVSCFAMIFVPLWKFLATHLTQISGTCSFIGQKWAWSWFYSTMEIDSPPFLWLMQPAWRKVITAWRYCWEGLIMTNLSGSYVVILMLWHCYTEHHSGTQNTVVSCASETAGKRRITMYVNCGLNKHHWRQGQKCRQSSYFSSGENLSAPFAHKDEPHEKLWIKPAMDPNMWGINSQMWVTQKSRRVCL